jgi:hypothetical protein
MDFARNRLRPTIVQNDSSMKTRGGEIALFKMKMISLESTRAVTRALECIDNGSREEAHKILIEIPESDGDDPEVLAAWLRFDTAYMRFHSGGTDHLARLLKCENATDAHKRVGSEFCINFAATLAQHGGQNYDEAIRYSGMALWLNADSLRAVLTHRYLKPVWAKLGRHKKSPG